jgi:ferritin-like metal-binding protein YciE
MVIAQNGGQWTRVVWWGLLAHSPGEEPAMEMNSLQDLFIHDLKDLYNAETQLVKALPKMAKAASDPDLKEAFQTHFAETEEHVARLERIFDELDESPKGKKCKAMEGLIEEGKELMEEDAKPAVMDAGLIGAAQKVEHYEIAGYGTARTYAQMLGNDEAARLLQQTLDEEGNTDKKLNALAMQCINAEAEGGDGQ